MLLKSYNGRFVKTNFIQVKKKNSALVDKIPRRLCSYTKCLNFNNNDNIQNVQITFYFSSYSVLTCTAVYTASARFYTRITADIVFIYFTRVISFRFVFPSDFHYENDVCVWVFFFLFFIEKFNYILNNKYVRRTTVKTR